MEWLLEIRGMRVVLQKNEDTTYNTITPSKYAFKKFTKDTET